MAGTIVAVDSAAEPGFYTLDGVARTTMVGAAMLTSEAAEPPTEPPTEPIVESGHRVRRGRSRGRGR